MLLRFGVALAIHHRVGDVHAQSPLKSNDHPPTSIVYDIQSNSVITDRTRSSATAEKQRVSCPHGGG